MSGERAQEGRWYTHVRRFPTLIGRTSDGTRIPGGPYTPTQLITAAVLAWLASKTTGAWAQFGRVGNIGAFAAIVGIPVFLLGKAPLGNRNPLRMVAGLVTAISSPAGGRYRGAGVKPPKPRRTTTTGRARVVAVDTTVPAQPLPTPTVPAPQSGLNAIQIALAGTMIREDVP